MGEKSGIEKGIFTFSECVYKNLKPYAKTFREMKALFKDFKRGEVFRYLSDDKVQIEGSEPIKLFEVNAVKNIVLALSEHNGDYVERIGVNYPEPDSTVTFRQILYFYFFVFEKLETAERGHDNTQTEFGRDLLISLYDSAGPACHLYPFKNVTEIIVYNMANRGMGLAFFKEENACYQKEKDYFKPSILQVNQNIDIRQERGSGRYEVVYEAWKMRTITSKRMSVENEQSTRNSQAILDREILAWKGFSENKQLTKTIVGLAIDAQERRLYYFNKLVNLIAEAQENCKESDEFPLKRVSELAARMKQGTNKEKLVCLSVNALTRMLNAYFDGSAYANQALSAYSKRFYVHNEEITKGEIGASDRTARSTVEALLIGESGAYVGDRRLQNATVSKELLLMLFLLLKLYAPQSREVSMEAVKRTMMFSRYRLTESRFDRYFCSTLSQLDKLAQKTFKDRLEVLREESAKMEAAYLEEGIAPFSNAVLDKTTRARTYGQRLGNDAYEERKGKKEK